METKVSRNVLRNRIRVLRSAANIMDKMGESSREVDMAVKTAQNKLNTEIMQDVQSFVLQSRNIDPTVFVAQLRKVMQ